MQMQEKVSAGLGDVIGSKGLITSSEVGGKLLRFTMAEYFSIVLLAAVCNALLPTIVNGISADGVLYAILNTFEISVIVWVGIFIGIRYALQIPDERID